MMLISQETSALFASYLVPRQGQKPVYYEASTKYTRLIFVFYLALNMDGTVPACD
uniref:Uncharacterized protein n=1 Tax=Anguilla anguilla TaxID=7936 RepID=A0A0E9WTM9_ANGAN